jgi:hypothetical protein
MSTSTAPIHPKVSASTIAGAVVTALVTVLSAVGVIVPADVSTAAVAAVGSIVTVVSFIAGYNKSA